MAHAHSVITCACQHLAEDVGKDYLVMVVSLPDGNDARRFQQAAEEIELMLENTYCRIVDFRVGPTPPNEQLPGHGTLAGVVLGPERRLKPDAEAFFAAVTSILESHNLVAGPEEIVH